MYINISAVPSNTGEYVEDFMNSTLVVLEISSKLAMDMLDSEMVANEEEETVAYLKTKKEVDYIHNMRSSKLSGKVCWSFIL